MNLKTKVGLPIPSSCLLEQAVKWLGFDELPLPIPEYLELAEREIPNDPRATEAKGALLLALRAGRLSATGVFIERISEHERFENITTDPRYPEGVWRDLWAIREANVMADPEKFRVEIEPAHWQRRGIDWSKSRLLVLGPDWNKSGMDAVNPIRAEYRRIEVPT